MTDYSSLFADSDTLPAGGDFLARSYRDGGPAELPQGVRYPMIFVLQGSLTLSFQSHIARIPTGSIVVLDALAIHSTECPPGTVVLSYAPPQRLSEYLGHCSVAFRTPYSPPVPILPPLEKWIGALLSTGTGAQDQEGYALRRMLAANLLDYPRDVLGQLYVPFFACTRGDCRHCRPGERPPILPPR